MFEKTSILHFLIKRPLAHILSYTQTHIIPRGGSNVGLRDPPGEVINNIYVNIYNKLVCGSVVWQQCKELGTGVYRFETC